MWLLGSTIRGPAGEEAEASAEVRRMARINEAVARVLRRMQDDNPDVE
jgi:hypothetical protein